MVKSFKIEEAPRELRQTGSIRRLVNEKIGASRLGIIFVEVLPHSRPRGLHYHVKRESVYIGVEGRAKATMEGVDYSLEPNTVVFISTGEKHILENIGDTLFKMIEVYSPLEPDRVEVPEQ